VEYETKEKSLKTEQLFANITYYKLWAEKHFGYYIIGLGDKGYGVSSTKENPQLDIHNPQGEPWLENHGEETKVHGQNGLA